MREDKVYSIHSIVFPFSPPLRLRANCIICSKIPARKFFHTIIGQESCNTSNLLLLNLWQFWGHQAINYFWRLQLFVLFFSESGTRPTCVINFVSTNLAVWTPGKNKSKVVPIRYERNKTSVPTNCTFCNVLSGRCMKSKCLAFFRSNVFLFFVTRQKKDTLRS